MSSSVLRRTLLPITIPGSWLFGAAVSLRNRHYEKRRPGTKLPAPVMSIGNLTLGGSGKTPLAAAVARRCLARGWRVAVLSRGYGRRDRVPFLIVSDGHRLFTGPSQAGDEPLELARSVPGLVVAVGSDRHHAGDEIVRRLGPHLFILDDGFQHRYLHRDLDLVCMDSGERLPDLRLVPAGRLREPLASLGRADGLVWTRWRPGRPSDRLSSRVSRALRSETPVLRARNVIAGYPRILPAGESVPSDGFRGRSVAVMAGIARPERLREELEAEGLIIQSFSFRGDHHRWTQEEMDRIAERARARGACALLTTGKDAVKLGGFRGTALPVHRIDLRAELVEEEIMDSLLDRLPPPPEA